MILGRWLPLKASVSSDKDPLFSTKLADCPLKSLRLIISFCIVSNKVSHWKWLQLTWVKDGTGTAFGSPGLWVKGDASPLDLHMRVLMQDLLDLDLHLCMGAFIVG